LKALVAAALVLLAAACSREHAPEQAPLRPGDAAAGGRVLRLSPSLVESGRVVVDAASRGAFREEATFTGEVTAPPDGAAELGAPVAGRVRDILAKEGDHVTKGGLLAAMDAAEVARTRADLARARAQRERAARILSQEEELDREQATSKRNLAEARSEFATSLADTRGAESLLSTFGAARGGRVEVRSPLAGVVVKRTVVLGQPVEPGALLFRVVDPSRLIVRANVPESAAGSVELGQTVSIEWPGRPQRCSGTVVGRAPSVERATRTLPFWARAGADCPELVEGAFVDITVTRGATTGVNFVIVPRDAVVEVDGVPVVFREKTRGEYRVQTVRLAHLTPSSAYVEDGISAGDRVVVQGAILLKGELMRAALE